MGKQQNNVIEFSEKESKYLKEQRLGRIATVSPDVQPHVVPVAFEFDGSHFYFGGWNLEKSLKFRNIRQNNKVAFVVDDLVSVDPWRVSGVEIKGIAEINKRNGNEYVKITPLRKSSWGLEGRDD
ncbi:MAG: PPOX class F420-dependent oxidoreductase [Nitrosopumilales archaeon]|nr:PPOX class F420-dependent oxidoreductase [Nitrosopumilales archaeon]